MNATQAITNSSLPLLPNGDPIPSLEEMKRLRAENLAYGYTRVEDLRLIAKRLGTQVCESTCYYMLYRHNNIVIIYNLMEGDPIIQVTDNMSDHDIECKKVQISCGLPIHYRYHVMVVIVENQFKLDLEIRYPIYNIIKDAMIVAVMEKTDDPSRSIANKRDNFYVRGKWEEELYGEVLAPLKSMLNNAREKAEIQARIDLANLLLIGKDV